MEDSLIVVLCTVPSEKVAEELARRLVENSLAACVNILPGVRSFYRWQGELQDDLELLMVVKTHSERFAALQQWLADAHPYEVPEIIALPLVGGFPPYLEWVRSQVSQTAAS